MGETEKFMYYPMRKPERIQPDCPVYIHGYGLAVQKGTDAAFVQVRLVNRCESPVHSVFLHISGRDPSGESLYDLRYVPLVDCEGLPHRDFGEEQVLFLPVGNVSSLDMEVEDVLFTDGMIWRRQMGQQLLTAEEAGWIVCSCGMMNPGEAEFCAYCCRPIAGNGEGVRPVSGTSILSEADDVISAEDVKEPVEWVSSVENPSAEEGFITEAECSSDNPEQSDVFIDPMDSFRLLLDEWMAGSTEDTETVELWDGMPSTDDLANSEGLSVASEEITQDSGLPMDLMQETGQIILELQRRIRAREAGEPISPCKEHMPTTEDLPVLEEEEDDGRGVGFWIFMILLMVVLALVGFFGVLYHKGYFG